MRRLFFPILVGSFFATAAFSDPAIITSDIQTGIILSSNNIDIKQDPYITGKLALLFIAMNDIMTKDIDLNQELKYPDGDLLSLAEVLQDAASSSLTSPVSITLLAGQVAQSPAILNERMSSLFKTVGMRATRIETVRSKQGEPSWSGFTTARDVARLTSALILTHGKYIEGVLPTRDAPFSGTWLYRDGVCMSTSLAPMTHRKLVTVIQGASSEENCANATLVANSNNDGRIGAVIGQAN